MHTVQIRVKGRLDESWSEWFAGFSLTYEEDGETALTGPLPDQAALYGLIGKLRDLGVQLIAVDIELGHSESAPC
jgi:hypothetical protein